MKILKESVPLALDSKYLLSRLSLYVGKNKYKYGNFKKFIFSYGLDFCMIFFFSALYYDFASIEFTASSFNIETKDKKYYYLNVPQLKDLLSRVFSLFNSGIQLYHKERESFQLVSIDPEVVLPKDFYKSPSGFIEKLSLIARGSEVLEIIKQSINLVSIPYDVTRVKRYKSLVFKRVDLSKVEYGLQELEEAQKIKKIIQGNSFSIPIEVQEFKGYVYNAGNIYLLSKYEEDAVDLNQLKLKDIHPEDRKVLKELKINLAKHHLDLSFRNILAYFDKEGRISKLVIIDFETKPKS